MIIIKEPLEFEWDDANQDKNWIKHEVSMTEAEEVFLDRNKQEYPDPGHSGKEERKVIVGETKHGRLLFIVFTIRNSKVRVISVRDLRKRKERDLYEKAPSVTQI